MLGLVSPVCPVAGEDLLSFAGGAVGAGRGMGRGRWWMFGFTSSPGEHPELRMLSMENARGLEGRGEGWEARGRRGRGMLRKGRKRKGLAMGFAREGGGEEMMEPEEEWNDVESGDLGDEAEDAGESQTLMMGELVSLLSGVSCSTLMPPTW